MGSAARRAHGSSAEHAMRDLIASNAPLRNGSHKARQNGPKHYPRGFNGGRSPLGLSFSPIFLQTKKDGVPGGRQLPNAAGKYEKQKDYVPGGRRNSREVGKNVKSKTPPPEGLRKVERPIKYVKPKLPTTESEKDQLPPGQLVLLLIPSSVPPPDPSSPPSSRESAPQSSSAPPISK